jgi:hypothetical protein
MDKSDLNLTLHTAGGKITCNRCTAKSKRSGEQCKKPALKTSRTQKCQFHGGRSTGPKTEKGRLNIALAKTQHGNETRQAKAERSEKTALLAHLEDIMRITGMTSAPRTRGRKPASYAPISTIEDAIAYMAAHPITS